MVMNDRDFIPIKSDTLRSAHITSERIDRVLDLKERFLTDPHNVDPRESSYISKEVAESWLRCRDKGIDPHNKAHIPHISAAEHAEIVESNRPLIEVTMPLMNRFKEMAVLPCGYIMYLCDKNGTFILQVGDMLRIPIEGIVWNENTIGTCVHSVCAKLKQPVQLYGPEHYCVRLHDIVGSAAPILGDDGEVIATIILGQPIQYKLEEDYFQNLLSHTLGLITALAKAIETQIKLNKSNKLLVESNENLLKTLHELNTTADTLEATLEVIDEGIITIDPAGKILTLNREAKRIFKIRTEDKGSRNINEFLSPYSQVIALVGAGKNTDLEENIVAGNDEQSYMINIRPICDHKTRQIEAAVLRLNHVEKVNAAATNRTGSIATYTFENIISEDEGFKRVLSLAKRFSTSPENILLIGESGTGKELFAQAIHNNYCPQGPFMAVNCAAMPRELIESELFGYEGGSFTGAERTGRPGKIELAHGGTLFLDEIGDMPLELQAVLLRALEDKQVMRIGGRRYKKVDFRLIAATNKNLFKMVKEKQYREDLYFRLSVLTINIPPLRNRKNDIDVLSQFFIKNYCLKQGWKTPKVTKTAIKKIQEYEWPGNIRQLQNALIFAVNSAQDNVIDLDNLPQYILLDSVPVNEGHSFEKDSLSLEYLERNAIRTALVHSKNSIPDAAKLLGISRSTLYRKLKDYGFDH
ncbi:sigma 54-interacting transcriptional regulator [Desulfitobacterium sp. THU1]|uniref:sigma-54-dependent Fis family transcriptional regulator n=1 Tax=Desulfitobacterium sp. THU1 TaxID=3138072 RepID=UPI00311F9A2B